MQHQNVGGDESKVHGYNGCQPIWWSWKTNCALPQSPFKQNEILKLKK